ncbi:MarR family winged helix-turn-helix transcriptional regulator [Rhodococcus koreensis]
MDENIDRFREDVTLFYRRIRMKRATHRLTLAQIQVLAHLDRQGPMSARTLARLEQVTPQSIARTVLSLEDTGMVVRTINPADARASIVSLTETGCRTLVEDRVRRSEWMSAALVENCTDIERDLLFVAGRLLRRLAEAPEPTLLEESPMS